MHFLTKSGKDYAIFVFQTGAKNLLPLPSTSYLIQSQLSTEIVRSSSSCSDWGHATEEVQTGDLFDLINGHSESPQIRTAAFVRQDEPR